MSQTIEGGQPTGRFALGVAIIGIILPSVLAILVAAFAHGADMAYSLCVLALAVIELVALVAAIYARRSVAGRWALGISAASLLLVVLFFMSSSTTTRAHAGAMRLPPGEKASSR